MRRLSRVAATATVVLAVVLLTPSISTADDDDNLVTGGSASGSSLTAVAGYFGGPSKGGRSCPWEKVWPAQTGSVFGVPITGFLTSLSFLPFIGGLFDSNEPDSIRSLTAAEAAERRDEAESVGEDAPDILLDVPGYIGDESHTHVEVVEGYEGVVERVVLIFSGAPDLGVVIDDTIAVPEAPSGPVLGPVDPGPTDEEIRDYYQARYPLVQRGEKLDGGDLWWDPYFIAPGAPGGCPEGVFYSPREYNADILLPDVVALVTENLPAVDPRMVPLDRYDGWAYVQVPTNFGVTNASIQTTVAHAEAEYIDPSNPSGPTASVWAQVEAIATHMVFNPGDGNDPVVCDLRDMPYDPDVPGPCSYVYLDSSNVETSGKFTPTVTVIWQGLYTSSNGDAQVIDISPTTTAFELAVAEARASVIYEP